MVRARKAAAQPAPEPEVAEEENGSRKRGPGKLAELHAAWIKQAYGVVISAEQLYLAQSTRNEFRRDPDSGYAEYKESQVTEEEAPADPAPAPRRARKAAAAAPAAEEAAEPAPAKATSRRRGAAKAAPAAAAEEPTEAAPAGRRRRTPPF